MGICFIILYTFDINMSPKKKKKKGKNNTGFGISQDWMEILVQGLLAVFPQASRQASVYSSI